MVTNPIQLNQPSHLRLHHGKSFLLLPHPPRKVVDLARATCYGELTSRVSIPWAHRATASTKARKARLLYTKGLNAGLLWPRSRVFVIIASTFRSRSSTMHPHTQRYLGNTPDCLPRESYLNALFEICLFSPPWHLPEFSSRERVLWQVSQGRNVEPPF